MVSKFKKFNIVLLLVFGFIIFNTYGVLASDSSTRDVGVKITTDVNKVWTVTFKSEVEVTSLTDNVQIRDITSGSTFSPVIAAGNNASSIKIMAPTGGYTTGHKYQLTLKNAIKSKSGKTLPKHVVFTFSVLAQYDNYNATASVTVSPVIDVFKQITISSTNLPDAQKYKVEGLSTLTDIGKPMVFAKSSSTIKVYICDSLGNVLATTNMDVSTTNSNMNLNLSF